jgi:hypothetical protein
VEDGARPSEVGIPRVVERGGGGPALRHHVRHVSRPGGLDLGQRLGGSAQHDGDLDGVVGVRAELLLRDGPRDGQAAPRDAGIEERTPGAVRIGGSHQLSRRRSQVDGAGRSPQEHVSELARRQRLPVGEARVRLVLERAAERVRRLVQPTTLAQRVPVQAQEVAQRRLQRGVVGVFQRGAELLFGEHRVASPGVMEAEVLPGHHPTEDVFWGPAAVDDALVISGRELGPRPVELGKRGLDLSPGLLEAQVLRQGVDDARGGSPVPPPVIANDETEPASEVDGDRDRRLDTFERRERFVRVLERRERQIVVQRELRVRVEQAARHEGRRAELPHRELEDVGEPEAREPGPANPAVELVDHPRLVGVGCARGAHLADEHGQARGDPACVEVVRADERDEARHRVALRGEEAVAGRSRVHGSPATRSRRGATASSGTGP